MSNVWCRVDSKIWDLMDKISWKTIIVLLEQVLNNCLVRLNSASLDLIRIFIQ